LARDGGGVEHAGCGVAGIPPWWSLGEAAFTGDPPNWLDRDDVADASEPWIRARLKPSEFEREFPGSVSTPRASRFFRNRLACARRPRLVAAARAGRGGR